MHSELKIAHCDVAARNCLVGEHEMVAVANLGNVMVFNRSTEMKPIPENSQLPIRWSAPEVIHDN